MAIAMLCLSLLLLAGAGLAAWTRMLIRRAEREFPPLGQFVAVNGIQLHVLARGDPRGAPPIVLLHGAFSALQDFSATIIDELAKTHRTLAIDRPGHGYSSRPAAPWVGTPAAQAELVHEALAVLGMKRPLFVGFSWGGAVALAHALRYPEQTAGLVLLASPTHPWPAPIEREYFLPTWPVIGPLLVHTIVAPIGRILAASGVERAFYPCPVSPRFVASPYPLATRPASFAANAEDLRVLKEELRDMVKHYGELRLPVALVHGTDDHTVGLRTHSERLHAQVPGTELIRIAGAGHQLLYTHPRVVLETIERVAARVGQPAR